jgi:hypothetical protein
VITWKTRAWIHVNVLEKRIFSIFRAKYTCESSWRLNIVIFAAARTSNLKFIIKFWMKNFWPGTLLRMFVCLIIQLSFVGLHGVVTQKSGIRTLTAVKTSNFIHDFETSTAVPHLTQAFRDRICKVVGSPHFLWVIAILYHCSISKGSLSHLLALKGLPVCMLLLK